MKLVILIAVIICTISSALGAFLFEKEWQDFKSLHGISYRSFFHDFNRRKIFEDNLQKIHQHNALYEQGIKSYKLGITPFADLTIEEFIALLTLKINASPSARNGRSLFKVPTNKTTIPDSIDWRTLGAVTNVKNQGLCGSCWAFSVTGSLEGQYFKKTGQLVSFSEQQLIDCATGKYEADGCNGGQFSSGFEYIRDQGIESEFNYPYEMYDDTCQADSSLVVTNIQGYANVESRDEDALLAAVGLIGPISAAFDAAQFDMQFYKEGIYESESCSQSELNHGVLVVGYGSKNGVDYWIVKNSWGKHFGIEGYMYMKRGINQCGIATDASYPVL